MKKIITVVALAFVFLSCNNTNKNAANGTAASTDPVKEVAKPEHLNEPTFSKKVCDFTSAGAFKYLGDKPCVVDFYADWCKPCKRLGPTMEELATEYQGKIYIYKVNVDENPNVSRYFAVDGIPAVFFIPMNGNPQTLVGLYPKEDYVKQINEFLLKGATK